MTSSPAKPAAPDSSLPARDRCLTAALTLLEASGPEAVSLREVARRAQLSPTAPYRHFDSKEDMLAVLAEQGFVEFSAALLQASPRGVHLMGRDEFLEMGLQYVRFAQANPGYYRLMFTSVIPDHETYPALFAAGDAAFDVLLQSIEILQRMGDIQAGEPRRLAAHVWSVCHGFASLYLEGMVRKMDPDAPWEQEFRHHFDWVMRGISAPP